LYLRQPGSGIVESRSGADRLIENSSQGANAVVDDTWRVPLWISAEPKFAVAWRYLAPSVPNCDGHERRMKSVINSRYSFDLGLSDARAYFLQVNIRSIADRHLPFGKRGQRFDLRRCSRSV